MKVLPTFTILYFIFYSSHLLPSCFAFPLSESGLPDAKTVARLKTVQNNQKVLLGYRYILTYVTERAWEQYMFAGNQLTDTGDHEAELGEGAYVYRDITRQPIHEGNTVVCKVSVDYEKFRNARRAFIPDEVVSRRLHSPPGVYHTKTVIWDSFKPKGSIQRTWGYLKSLGDPAKQTILASRIHGYTDNDYQVLIPPYFLKRDANSKRPGGSGDLGMDVECTMISDAPEIDVHVTPNWRMWWSEIN
ncbi:hypothetical protein C8R42DRAFT_227011 [Lentinula raphanica]|nr:hypothetical protein C8R42DRAFT_227011 [Lentinula raphanica]